MKNKSFKLNIEEYVYEKVKKADAVINIPTEPIYFQEWNHRAIFGIFPQFAVWADGSVYSLIAIEVTDDSIRKVSIAVNEKNLTDIVSMFNMKGKSTDDYFQDKIIKYLKDNYDTDRVSKKVFDDKLVKCVKLINEITN